MLVTIEEGSVGGFGCHVLHYLAENGLLERGLKVRTKVMPDLFVDQDKPEVMCQRAGLTAQGIVDTVCDAIQLDRPTAREARGNAR